VLVLERHDFKLAGCAVYELQLYSDPFFVAMHKQGVEKEYWSATLAATAAAWSRARVGRPWRG
jgi:hypothetical protein